MQTKTIRTTIENKLTGWLSTITDEKLRAEVRKNLLVSGGSITSMFLNEPVNDYDIYIQDMNVLVKLAEFYCPGIVLDGRKRDQYVEQLKRNNGYSEDEDQGMDFVRVKNLKPDQVKLDIVSEGKRYDIITEANKPSHMESVPKYQLAFLSQNAISLTDDLQIVLRFSGTPAEIHKNFDFLHATNYFTFEDGLVTNIKALESTLTKTLYYQGSLYPLTSIIRMKKFILRGWKINAGEILKIMFQISDLDLRDPEVLEEQLIGVDIAYFAKLIEVLRGVATEKLTSPYLNEIIDRIFNDHVDAEDPQ